MNKTENGRIIIVELISTGFNYVEDCIRRGYEPVVLEGYLETEEARDAIRPQREHSYERLKYNVRILKASADYAETLAMVRAEEPVLVLPGSEDGVILATRLGDDLGLPGNSYSNIEAMTNKAVQQKALETAGLRAIRGRVVTTEEEAIQFYDSLGNENVVVKPLHGAASVGVRLCCGKEEMLHAFRENKGSLSGLFHIENEVLIQERIMGTEYIVNTVTRNGRTALASVWEYEKIRLDNGSNIYAGTHLITEISALHYDLISYALQIPEALGIEYGPIHGEYIVDEKGPVLIEANCRCMGNSFPAAFGDLLYGHHETDIVLDSYLDEEFLREYEKKDYSPARYGIMKNLISAENMDILASPIIQFLPEMRSFFCSMIKTSARSSHIPQTIDLDTSLGAVFLCHDDPAVTKADYQTLLTLEKNYFGLLYNEFYDNKFMLDNVRYEDLEDVYFELKKRISSLKEGETLSFTRHETETFPYGLPGLTIIMNIFGMALLAPHWGREERIVFRKKKHTN